ncbi:protein kinase [Pseudomonadota bacterium]
MTKNIDIDSAMLFLSSVDLFINLDSKIIKNMAERMSTGSYDPGDYLIRRGNPGQHMMLIKQGQVSVMLKGRGVALEKGDVIGEMSLISGRPSKADVIARTPTEVFILESNDFQALMSEYAELATVMNGLMKSRFSAGDEIHILGKYRILNQLGEGGTSIVYNAFDTELEREVAIKMLKYEIATSEDFKRRFRQEAKIIARLKHPNILHVIETIQDYSTEFIVIEKLDGYELNDYLKQQGVFSSKQTCEILYQVALALEHANSDASGGIIHRDVKLSNIVLDDRGHVKLMDFGIATTNENASEHYEGTVLYMAPELLQNKPIDHRVDIYALGITAYAMLTGKTPFTASSVEKIIENHLTKEPAKIEDLIPDIHAGLAEFIHRALVKNPEDRISSWHEIAALLNPNKSSGFELEASSEMDMAIIIKMKTSNIDKDEIIREFRWTLDRHGADYEIETAKKETQILDIDLN